MRRLNDPIVAALIDRPIGLSDEQRQIALQYFLMRKTRRELARDFNLTPFEIARVISYVQGWCIGMKTRTLNSER